MEDKVMQGENTAFINYSVVMEKYAVATVNATVDIDQTKGTEKVKSVLILCLDKSGSMSGMPMEAVKKGALEVANAFDESQTFDKFLTIAFDNSCTAYEYKHKDQYEKLNNQLNAGGGTSFDTVFDTIDKYYLGDYKKYKDCTIMFMSDGGTNRASAISSMNKLQNTFALQAVSYRFLCIGFSQNHDANLLGEIARAGSDLGNFEYIHESSENLKDEIKEALKQAFALAPGASSLVGRVYEEAENGYDVKIRLLRNEGSENEFSSKMVFALNILKEKQLKLELECGTYEIETVEVPPENAEEGIDKMTYFFNNHVFQLITQAQIESSKEKLLILFEEVKELDQNLNKSYIEGLKIKNRDERKKRLQPIHDIKAKISKLVHFLRDKQLDKSVSNDFIASLNAMAYSGVRGTAMQKKIDKRAIVNEQRFEEFKKGLEEYVSQLDMKKIREENKDITEKAGDCFLTTKDVFECIEDYDCLCICLDIRRSEAAIADPTKLVIKKIIPNFLSADAFIEATQFAIAADSEAQGGFGKNDDAEILVGVGRESITGVLPLFMFKEHFEVARKKIAQILGLMCTLDPMGYTPEQFFTVPYLVLHRAFTDYYSKKSDIKKFIYDQCYNTCDAIFNHVDKNRKDKFLAQISNMVKDEIYTTQEHIPSVPLFLA
jgi:uncharacterized protein YegL